MPNVGSSVDPVVVIPVYRPLAEEHEKIAADRCQRVLGRHRRVLLTHAGVDLSEHQRLGFSESMMFDAHFFRDISGYNKLMLSRRLYTAFRQHSHILIYQLDAFVFEDRLEEWCRSRFDYIGAPWFKSLSLADLRLPGGMRGTGVGNGGFSLRRVKAFIRVLTFLGILARRWQNNEDLFWAVAAPSYWPFFRVPGFEQALRFAFETRPRECFDLSGGNLPFGCHAWNRYDVDFWRPVFLQLGYRI
jgi:Protein of unknown function (DUF5672)